MGFEVERENAMEELGGIPGDTQVAALACLWPRYSQTLGPSLKSYIERGCPIQSDCRGSEGLGAMLTLQALTALALLSCVRQAAGSWPDQGTGPSVANWPAGAPNVGVVPGQVAFVPVDLVRGHADPMTLSRIHDELCLDSTPA